MGPPSGSGRRISRHRACKKRRKDTLTTSPLIAGTEGNAPADASSGTWVRVAEWLAGPNWGSHFLPRIGTEVLVDFIYGDIDRPLVVGQCYNGADLPPFSAGVDSAANHPGTVSGWHSHNHEGKAAGTNQWLTDDAPGQLRTRLATSETEAQLGLGHLIDQSLTSASRGPWRGSGFELRTDGWLAVRAGEGMLISTSARQNATSTQMDVSEAVGQLRAAEQTAQALSDAAAAQGAQPLKANTQQTEFIDGIDPHKDGKYEGAIGGQEAKKANPGSRTLGEPTERFSKPYIVTEGPDDIGLSTPASTVLFASQNVHATIQEDLHIASAHTYAATVGEAASWFTHSGGIKSIAAAGTHTIQAHTDEMEILADDSVTITSSNDEIHITAKDTIVLKAGQSSVTLKGGDITFACPGTFSVKGAGNAFEGPGSEAAVPEHLPHESVVPSNVFCVRIQTQYGQQSLAGKPYQLRIGSQTFNGTLGSDGSIYADVSRHAKKGTLMVWPYGPDNEPWQWALDVKQQVQTDDIKGIQSRLRNLGFYTAAIDGKYGPKTRAALRRFQSWKNLSATSEMTSAALSRLGNQHDI